MENLFKKTTNLYENYKESFVSRFNSNQMTDEEIVLFEPDENDWVISELKKINKVFEREYKRAVDDKKYFYGCTVEIYMTTYNSRLRNYINSKTEADELDFLFSELEVGLIHFIGLRIERENLEMIERSLFKRFLFIKRKCCDLDVEIELINNGTDYSYKLKANNLDHLIDYEPEIGFYSLPKKIVLLNELGIIEFLRTKKPFDRNRNALAKVISRLTNERATTVEPSLRGLDGSPETSPNNPYRNKKNLQKVETFLSSL
jgi:hypothetical protein